MNILVIKQTSLGDVLHASAMIRAIKMQYPQSKLTLFTATVSADIYKYSPWVDEIILIDRDAVKRTRWATLPWLVKYIYTLCKQLRRQKYDLAFDLQGLAKTLFFLRVTRAKHKYAKSHWPLFKGYRNKKIHAIEEMKRVLEKANIAVTDSRMELPIGNDEQQKINQWLEKSNLDKRPILLISPFSRSTAKDWQLENYIEVAKQMDKQFMVVFVALATKKPDIDAAFANSDCAQWHNLAGQLSIVELAALTQQATLLLTGDSFPMHLAGSQNTPVIALFGPTNEDKIGPLNNHDQVIRHFDCVKSNKKCCHQQNCITHISVARVIEAINKTKLGKTETELH